MDSVSRMAAFVEVVKQASFIGAARVLGVSGPAVTKQVQALESELGVKLLVRTTRHVSTTDEGELYFRRVSRLLEDLDEIEQEVRESQECPSGHIKINVPHSFGTQYLAKSLAAFAADYPDVQLEVEYSDRWVDVIAEGYDLVIRIGTLEDSQLVARQLGKCPILLCATPEFASAHAVLEHPDQVADLRALTYSQHGNRETWRYQHRQTGVAGKVQLRRCFASNSAKQQLEACLAGVGVALLPIFSAHEYLQSGALIQLLPEYETAPERGIYALYPQNRFLATRVRLLIDWLIACSDDFPW